MKKRFTDAQIINILKEAESGISVPELCRKHGICSATFYKWRSKYGGLDVSMVSHMRSLEEENRRLKRTYADSQMQNEILKEVLEKK